MFVYVCPSWFIVVHSDSWWLLWTYLVYCGVICNHVRNVQFSMIQSLWLIFSHFFAMAFRVLERMTTSHNMTSPVGILLNPLFFTLHRSPLSTMLVYLTSADPKEMLHHQVQRSKQRIDMCYRHFTYGMDIMYCDVNEYYVFFFKSSLLVDC